MGPVFDRTIIPDATGVYIPYMGYWALYLRDAYIKTYARAARGLHIPTLRGMSALCVYVVYRTIALGVRLGRLPGPSVGIVEACGCTVFVVVVSA